MNKLVIFFILISIAFINCMAFDPVVSDEKEYERILKAHRIRQACKIFENVTELEATKENVKGVLLGSIPKKNAVSFAVEIYALSSEDTLEEKQKNIIKCAQEHMDAWNILYQCAESLSPSKESIELYNKILSNEDFDIARHLLALRQLLQLGEFPKKTIELIVMGFLSGDEVAQKRCFELYNQLKIYAKNSEEVTEYIQQINELLRQKDLLNKLVQD